MSKSIVVTFGWTESPVIGAIVRHGLESGDRIILLKPTDSDERAEKAVGDLRAFLRNIAGVELVEKEIDVSNFVNAVISIKRLLDSESLNRDLIVNLSGGMRVLVLATYLASLFTKKIRMEIESENRKFRVVLPSISISHVLKLKNTHLRILKILQLYKGECSIKDLMISSKFSRSTLYAYIKDLENLGLVKRSNKRGSLKITDRGMLLATLLGG